MVSLYMNVFGEKQRACLRKAGTLDESEWAVMVYYEDELEEGANEDELDEPDSSLTNLLYSDDSESEEYADPDFMQEITDSHSKIAKDSASDSSDLTESLDGTSDLSEASGRIDLSTISQKTRDLGWLLTYSSNPSFTQTSESPRPRRNRIHEDAEFPIDFCWKLLIAQTKCLIEYAHTITIMQNNGKTLLIKTFITLKSFQEHDLRLSRGAVARKVG